MIVCLPCAITAKSGGKAARKTPEGRMTTLAGAASLSNPTSTITPSQPIPRQGSASKSRLIVMDVLEGQAPGVEAPQGLGQVRDLDQDQVAVVAVSLTRE